MTEKHLISMDPGLRSAGWARFDDGVLVACGCLQADSKRDGPSQWWKMATEFVKEVQAQGPIDVFAFETMSTRKGKDAAHASLIELSIISGLIAGMLGAPIAPVPANTWTRGRNKATNELVMRRAVLDGEEVKVLDAGQRYCRKQNRKEVSDAVGIGLYTVQRWK